MLMGLVGLVDRLWVRKAEVVESISRLVGKPVS